MSHAHLHCFILPGVSLSLLLSLVFWQQPFSSDPLTTEHVVLLKLKDGVSESELASLSAGLGSLVSIPGVRSVGFGETYVNAGDQDRRFGFNYALAVTLETREALTSYATDALHLDVKKRCILPLLRDSESVLAVDFDAKSKRGKKGGEWTTLPLVSAATFVAFGLGVAAGRLRR